MSITNGEILNHISSHRPFDTGADSNVFLLHNLAIHHYFAHVTEAIFSNYFTSTIAATSLSGRYLVESGVNCNIQFNTILDWFKSSEGNIVSISPRREGLSGYTYEHAEKYHVTAIAGLANRLLESNTQVHPKAKVTPPNMRVKKSWTGLLICHITDIGDGLRHFA